jgi:mannose-6-phosphate isomerase-like protein (cupin superfamily)
VKPYFQYKTERFQHLQRDELLAIARSGEIGEHPTLLPIFDALRKFIPMPGERDWRRAAQVILETGKNIARHDHPEWVALYYVDPGDPPVAVHIEGDRIEPENGMVIVMPPGTWHSVEESRSARERLAFAILVEVKPP